MYRFLLCIILLPWQINCLEQINLIIKSNFGTGFFCEFNKVIAGLHRYDENKLASITVDWSDQFFPYKNVPTENGWSLYFDEICAKSKNNKLPDVELRHPSGLIHNYTCSLQWLEYEKYLPYRLSMHDKIKKHIRIHHTILDDVDAFCAEHFSDALIVGLHIRHARIHAKEMPSGIRPTMRHYQREIDAILAQHQNEHIKIFLASDSHAVIDYFKKIYDDRLIAIEAFRAKKDEDPHLVFEKGDYYKRHIKQWHKDKPGYWGGATALMDCLLLARCDYFIHSSSNLAQAVTFFNPYIASIYVPKIQSGVCRCVHPRSKSPNPDFMPK